MTKKDEFIEKIEQLDPHLKVQKFDDVFYDLYGFKTAVMIVWYKVDNDYKLPFATFEYINNTLAFKTDCIRFAKDKDKLILYSKVIKLCADYFPFLLEEGYL